jgi:hypothetical protein
MQWCDELHEIIVTLVRWLDVTGDLDVTPSQLSIHTIKEKPDSFLRTFDAHFKKALKERCAIEIEGPDTTSLVKG